MVVSVCEDHVFHNACLLDLVQCYKRKFELAAKMPCSCLCCCGVSDATCPCVNMRDPMSHWVSERKDNSARTAELQGHYEPLVTRLAAIFGTDMVTKKMIQDKLRLLNLPVSGLKHVVAKRLQDFMDKNPDTAGVQALAANYITMDMAGVHVQQLQSTTT